MNSGYPPYIIEGAMEVLRIEGRFDELLEKYADELDYELRQAGMALAFYLRQRENGTSKSLAAMTAMQASPRSMTDRELFSGIGTLADQFADDPAALENVVAAAKARGYTPNPNDFYMANMSLDGPGDPLAFVPATGGRGHIKKVCEMRGVPCEGSVNVAAREPEDPPKPKHRLSPGIVDRKIREMVQQNPALSKVPKRDLKEEIISKHSKKKV